jgi:hypothetical protein
MNPRHAAALALVGWYLMVPPAGDNTATLKYWLQEGSFDTAKECEAGQLAYRNHYDHMSERDWNTWDEWYSQKYKHHLDKAILGLFQDSADHSLCVSSDDPRLKEK